MWKRAVVLASLPLLLAAVHLDDRMVFAAFDQVNGFDIQAAKLAVVRGGSEEVRGLAAEVLSDHAMVLQMARSLAARKGVTYRVSTDDAAARQHAATMRDLGRLQGAAFDSAYMRFEVRFHDGAIRAVRNDLLPQVSDPDLRALLTTVLPGFEAHLRMTREVAAGFGVR